jgi:hypothetical protein
MDWAKLWAIFSQARLVTLNPSSSKSWSIIVAQVACLGNTLGKLKA